MVFNTKRIQEPFLRNLPERASKAMPLKVFICQQENTKAVRSLRAKIVMRSLAKRPKNYHFCA